MKLNIYEKRKIVKTYEVETYDLMFGTIEDIANAIDLDSLQGGSDVDIIKAIGNLVVNSMDTIKELLKDIFDGITDEELKHTKVSEITNVIIDVVFYTIKQLSFGKGKN